ncbi:hypothetical protein LTR50_004382 [Elasticomyces elasticus]|nr:hypothetical protein LTR50_004382 [Elasticomyces elasticus]
MACVLESNQPLVTTTFIIPNLHCVSCTSSIESALLLLKPPPVSVSYSIASYSVTVRHDVALSLDTICDALESAGFEVHSAFDHHEGNRYLESRSGWESGLEEAVLRWSRYWRDTTGREHEKQEKHMEQCRQCRAELAMAKVHSEKTPPPVQSKHASRLTPSTKTPHGQAPSRSSSEAPSRPASDFAVIVDSAQAPRLVRASFAISGMTCGSCVDNISRAIEQHPWVRSADVILLTNSASVVFNGREHVNDIVESIADAGYDASIDSLQELEEAQSDEKPSSMDDIWIATYAIGGMTCSACIGTITDALKQEAWVESVNVNLISHSATVAFRGKDHLDSIKNTIEDIGYEATLDVVSAANHDQKQSVERKIAIRIEGFYCRHCPQRLMDALNQTYGELVKIETPLSISQPTIKLVYRAQPPSFTIRHILETIRDVDPAFRPTIYHLPTMEERSKKMYSREQRRILFRLALSVIVAVPTFIIGIVFTSLVGADNLGRRFLMSPMWAGRVTRAEWALFIMATVIYFFAADTFHVHTLKGIRTMWKPGSRVPMLQRFYRFGSMNMLITLGTSIAYFASIAELAINATRSYDPSSVTQNPYYFDSVVFLTMFLLIGRFLEAYSKAKTGDAVTSLGLLRPNEAILVSSRNSPALQENSGIGSGVSDQRVPVDLLEIGDIVRVPHGTSPPFDGVITQGEAKFDESSLTGESRLVRKTVGETVYSGTVNKAGSILIQITSISGTSLLDQIIKVVREGQTRRAPVERIADIITSHFVPFVVFVGVLTWIVWLSLGLSGALPKAYLDIDTGGWPLWSLQFSIAVFVVACPCGIGLAAPTALFVGGGLAAQHGILVKGGGEAFQEASTLDCVVFDKTGTLTQGGEPAVTNHEILSGEDEKLVLDFARTLEESSSHPIARSIVSFCDSHSAHGIQASVIEEIPGKGMKGHFNPDTPDQVAVIIGNEALMADYGLQPDAPTTQKTDTWKAQGKSIALLAIGRSPPSTSPPSSPAENLTWRLSAAFAISDPIRPEASTTIRALQRRGLAVWLLSGDNATTARAVGAAVGIPAEHIIAGVLPEQKAEKIRYLQRSLHARRGGVRGHWSGAQRGERRATVAMVGDGINDAPALAVADVGVAVGSGSDVALSSADFVLLSSDLTVLLTLIDLSRTVLRRIWFNFGWALVYNLIALPVAAGVLYPVRSGGGGGGAHNRTTSGNSERMIDSDANAVPIDKGFCETPVKNQKNSRIGYD